jgi:DNA polymerase III subunit epsilon
MANTYAVIDFETTGLSPAYGARPTEIAVVLIKDNTIIDQFQSLMNPGVRIPHDIQMLTGITNEMVKKAPAVDQVMAKAAQLVGRHPIVAHNAAFDRKFWDSEVRVGRGMGQHQFVCSLLLARRLFPAAPNHKLRTLVDILGLPTSGTYHRALADAECTAHLLIRLQQELIDRYKIQAVDIGLLLSIQTASRHQLAQCVQKYQGAR